MKTKHYIATMLIALAWTGCTLPKNLPEPQEVDSYQYGCPIKVKTINYKFIHGELLAVDSVGLFILPNDPLIESAIFIRQDSVKDYIVYFAKPKNYSWTIPAYAVLSFSHGVYAVLTLPLNLLVTSFTTSHALRTYTYNNKSLPLDQLRMFSRYPQGLPPNYKNLIYR